MTSLLMMIEMLMTQISYNNLNDLPPPRLERESIFTHHEAKHHQGEDLACVCLVMIMTMRIMCVMTTMMMMITRPIITSEMI